MGDAPADRARGLVELTPAARRLRTALAAVLVPDEEARCSTLPFREHQRDGDATNAQQAPQAPVIVVLEAFVQTVEPLLNGVRLWPGQVDDEARFRYRPADLDMWRAVEDGVDVVGQRNGRVP
jgi:hypothetical protein